MGETVDGTAVGAPGGGVGSADGVVEGTAVGAFVGTAVGAFAGTAVGDAVAGVIDGVADGAVDGDDVEGAAEGVCVGALDGGVLGIGDDGATDGNRVGSTVGAFVDSAVATVTLRILLLPWSAMYTLPDRSTATPWGRFSIAEVAAPLSPLDPAVVDPVPAIVVIVPVDAATLRILLIPLSEK